MNYPRILKISQINLATILLVVFYLSEGFSKLSIFYFDGKSDLPRIIKSLVLLFLLFSISKSIKNFIFPILLLIIFLIGQFLIEDGFNIEILVSFSKFLFPIFLFIYFNNNTQDQEARIRFFKTFEWLLIFNGFLILSALLLDQGLFKTYNGSRFGYNGLFITSATSSYVYTVALFYFLAKLKHSFFKNWKVLFLIVCCLIVGTKALYISLFGVFLVFLFYYSNLKIVYRRLLMFSFIAISLIAIYLSFFQFGLFNEIRLEKGLFSSLLSFRDDLLISETIPFVQNNWTWPNYLFGGISDLESRSQLGFIDIFYFWGILGGIGYLYVFSKTFINFSLQNWQFYFFVILAVIVFLAGNFFENASVAIYLLILKEKLIDITASSDKKSLHE